jgi:hypothetical protein
MLFRKKENLDRLYEVIASEMQERTSLEKGLQAAKMKWLKCQAEIETLISHQIAHNESYRRPVHEEFFHGRRDELKKAIAEKIAERDQLTEVIGPAIRKINDRIHRRRETVISAFTGWASGICGVLKNVQIIGAAEQYELAEPTRSELEAFWRRVPDSTAPLPELVDEIRGWVEKIEEIPELRQPLFQLDSVVLRALEIK